MKTRLSLLIVLVALTVIAAVWSTLWIVAPGQQTLDARVQRVASQLKCLICQGESVADSPSTLAQQMRASIRHQLQTGRSEQDVIQYFEQRYGNQIVWSPPWQGFSLLVWLVPIAFLLCGIGLVILLLREWRTQGSAWRPKETERHSKGIERRPIGRVGTGLAPVRKTEARANQTDHNNELSSHGPTGPSPVPTIAADLERYRAQLEAELAEDDIIFRKPVGQSNL